MFLIFRADRVASEILSNRCCDYMEIGWMEKHFHGRKYGKSAKDRTSLYGIDKVGPIAQLVDHCWYAICNALSSGGTPAPHQWFLPADGEFALCPPCAFNRFYCCSWLYYQRLFRYSSRLDQ